MRPLQGLADLPIVGCTMVMPRLRSTRRLGTAVGVQWRELGVLGRVALAGVALSLLLAVALGITIQRAVERHVLDARMAMLAGVVDDLTFRGLMPFDGDDEAVLATLDEAVSTRLLGGDTMRVKVWAPDGTIVYSDVPDLVGQQFPLSSGARRALQGQPSAVLELPVEAENAHERGMGQLLEFYLPMTSPPGEVVGLFEVYQWPDTLLEAMAGIRRAMWLTIGSGLGILATFMGALTLANARELDRRRRHAERLLHDLLHGQDEERRRVVGALHDDVGQPLYRLLYGLQGCRARLAAEHPAAAEIARLEDLVRELDASLRSELRLLHRGLLDGLDLDAALADLADSAREESGIDVQFSGGLRWEPDPLVHAALFRAGQEALTNVRKHADATRAAMRLRRESGHVVLEVMDDGRGVQGEEGLGLATTRERLAAVGGGLLLESADGAGTTLRAWVPADVEGVLS